MLSWLLLATCLCIWCSFWSRFDNRKWRVTRQLLQWSRWTHLSGSQLIKTEWALTQKGFMTTISLKAWMVWPMHWIMLTHVRGTFIYFYLLFTFIKLWFGLRKINCHCWHLSFLFAQACIWTEDACIIENPYWSPEPLEPKATCRLWSPFSPSHTAPAKTHQRNLFPSVLWRTSQMLLSTHCRSVLQTQCASSC